MVVVVGRGERAFCALFNTCTQKVDSALAALSFSSFPTSPPGPEAPALATGGEIETGRQRGAYLNTNIQAYHRSGFAEGFGVSLGLPNPKYSGQTPGGRKMTTWQALDAPATRRPQALRTPR